MTIKETIKDKIYESERISKILALLYSFFGGNKITGKKNNKLQLTGSFIRHTTIILKGSGNEISFDETGNNHICDTVIHINGNNNRVVLGKNNSLYNCEIIIDDDGGSVVMGNGNKFCGKTHIAAIEGTSVYFGDDCLFSSDVTFRTGDSHSIISTETGKRINPSLSINIGNRVWFGNHTTILKGVTLQDDTIVGTGSIVTQSIEETNVVLAGAPARVVKRNVCWDTNRIPIE